nr:M48 family metallopeptidase [Sphingomonas aerophila]
MSLAQPFQLLAEPTGGDDTLSALQQVDGQLAAIGYRLVTTNLALCDRVAPSPGWVIHALAQYDSSLRSAATARFGFEAPVAVETVVPGSAAATAGVQAGDSVLAVNGTAVSAAAPTGKAGVAERDAALALIASQPAAAPLSLDLLRNGRRRQVTIAASPGCQASFELKVGPGLTAASDGQGVQIGSAFFARWPEDEVAAVVAHEMAHLVLRHRSRLEAAGITSGMLAELGRAGRIHRRVEDEADRLSVALLYNAGFDPSAAVRLWRNHGGQIDGGLFRSRTHPSSKARAAALEQEIAAIPPGSPRPYRPALIDTRSTPLQ